MLGPFSEGLARVRIGDKWGFIDTKGAIVINPQFDDARVVFGGIGACKNWRQVGIY